MSSKPYRYTSVIQLNLHYPHPCLHVLYAFRLMKKHFMQNNWIGTVAQRKHPWPIIQRSRDRCSTKVFLFFFAKSLIGWNAYEFLANGLIFSLVNENVSGTNVTDMLLSIIFLLIMLLWCHQYRIYIKRLITWPSITLIPAYMCIRPLDSSETFYAKYPDRYSGTVEASLAGNAKVSGSSPVKSFFFLPKV